MREARAVNRINHENIVEITDYGETEDGLVYLVMEYLAGESLIARLQRGALSELEGVDVALQIAAGLGRAHQMGVVHRDLKPDNILLVTVEGAEERVKVLDFGIAKLLDMPSLTASDRIFGTPGYIAPEYASGAPIDGRADLYSLGVVLYECVTGQLPFDAEYHGDLLIKHMLEPPIPPIDRKPSISRELNDFILRCLAKDPAQRFRDAFHFVEELSSLRAKLESRSKVPTERPRRSEPPGVHPETSGRWAAVAVGQPPPESVTQSPGGGRAWEKFINGVRDSLGVVAEPAVGGARPSVTLRRMSTLADAMIERFELVDQLRSRLLALEARGRDFRATIGRAMDVLGQDLSTKARDRDAIAATRDQTERRRDELVAEIRSGTRRDEGDCDALLWQIAASNEILRNTVGECEDLEYQLQQLGVQLDRLNESLEVDQNRLVEDLDAALGDVRRLDRDLRDLYASLPPAGER